MFVRAGTEWSQQAYLKASNTAPVSVGRPGQWFGRSVALSGDTVIVGAIGESSSAKGVNGNQADASAPGAGAAYIFVRTRFGPRSSWAQEAYLKPSNTAAGQAFGVSVAVSGDTVVVGASLESSSAKGVNGNQTDTSAQAAGATYVFVRSRSVIKSQASRVLNPVPGADLSLSFWVQEAYLKSSNTAAGQAFGVSVAVSGDTVVVGAIGESSNATGVNGNQNDTSAFHAGAAYALVRAGTNWSQLAYLKASNTASKFGRTQLFGISMAVSGDTLVVGAEGESSNATGVNGNQADTSAPDAGAAYVFSS